MNQNETKVVYTLEEALILKDNLYTECKALAEQFKISSSKQDLDIIERKNENLNRVSTAVLDANSKLGNNTNIKKMEFLTRKKELLSKTIKNMKRDNSILNKVMKFVGKGKTKYDIEELTSMLQQTENSIQDLRDTLTEFNQSNKIEIVLLNV